MNKSELAQKLAERTNLSKSDASKAVEALFSTDGIIAEQLRGGGKVQITGFGKFYVQRRDARQGINPQTKQRINIPASKVPKFTAGNALKDSIK